MILEQFKEKIKNTGCFGIFSKTTDSNFIEAAGLAGLDFIILDMEHGSATLETMHNHTRAAIISQCLPIIRVKDIDPQAISAALDAGAMGVQIPNITTAKQAFEAVKAAKFHPQGMRGMCRFVKAAKFGIMPKQTYFKEANETLVVLQVEGTEGISNLDEILAVEGFDILFIGPYDLSQSIGKPGEIDSPEVLQLMSDIAKKATSKGILLGAFSDNLKRNQSLIKEGFNYIAYSVDVNIFSNAIHDLLNEET